MSKTENRDRRLRRNPLDIAEDEAVEHDVTEHDDTHARKGGYDLMLDRQGANALLLKPGP